MTEETEQERPTLEGEAALDLWRKGRQHWNSWIVHHPGWDISFVGIDFSPERDNEGNLSFAGYRFGNGNLNFSNANFGNGNVHFIDTIFGDGQLCFSGATFGSGNVYFTAATFGGGDIDFSEANLGNGNVYFSGIDFHTGNVDFSNATFGDGTVDFSYSNLNKDSLIFFETTFGKGELNFFEATFGDCEVDFSETIFGSRRINFDYAKIKELNFNPQTIGSCHIEAEGLSIKGRAIFMFPSSAATLKSFILHSASFDGPLTLRGNLDIIPDLRATRYSHQVDLSDLKVKLPRTSIRLGWPPKFVRKAEYLQDGAKLRRLKEIAETNKDHQAALRFSADENRAKRWIETSWAGSVLDMAFSAFSDYGQNILRPFVALIVLTAASIGAYKTLTTATFTNWWTGWAEGAVLSASNSLPFLPQSRDLREDALTALYGADPGLWVNAIMIGLGLRNRFRL